MENEDIAKELDIFPEIMKVLAEDFKPNIGIPLKKVEGKALMEIKFSEGRPMSYYCEKVSLENGSFTYLADKLEEKGFIERIDDAADRRKKVLVLTPKGKEATDEIHAQFQNHLMSKLAVLDDRDKEILMDTIGRLKEIKSKIKERYIHGHTGIG